MRGGATLPPDRRRSPSAAGAKGVGATRIARRIDHPGRGEPGRLALRRGQGQEAPQHDAPPPDEDPRRDFIGPTAKGLALSRNEVAA